MNHLNNNKERKKMEVPSNHIVFAILALVFCCLHVGKGVDPEKNACVEWKAIAGDLEERGTHQLASGSVTKCRDHSSQTSQDKCEQLDCEGRVILGQEDSKLAALGKLDMLYCMKAIFYHCENPPRIQFALNLKNKNVNVATNITHNSKVLLNGLGSGNARLGLQVYLVFELSRISSNSFTFKALVRAHVSYVVSDSWITLLTIIPETILNVTTCNSNMVEVPFNLKCDNPLKDYTSDVVPEDKLNITASATFNKTCTIGDLNSPCDPQREACGMDNQQAKCLCAADFLFDWKYKACVLKDPSFQNITPRPSQNNIPSNYHPAAPGAPNAAPKSEEPSKSKIDVKVVAIGSVVGVLVLVAIVVVVVMVMRKKRTNVRRGQLLLADDDMDDVI